ncbi:MAG: prepilin-type N-terminal cleavage/methylation domain-containing protein [Candidatus Saccharimonadales bacterium]|nr:prepilin-type N-terminal cleavage/methylation domain-containing protein [Candidatus Saccharimonadales bacterium]
MKQNRQTGFTIVELLIVIVVIGVLAALVLNTFRGIQDRARIAQAEDALLAIETAVLALQVDTSKWPNGCPPYTTNDPEVNIETQAAGLTQQPAVGVVQAPCEWTASDVSNWQGPYWADENVLDPWGGSYQFDPDYRPWTACGSKGNLPEVPAVVSWGEDGAWYTCDDIYRAVDLL